VGLVFAIYEGGGLVERIEEASMVGVTSREEIHALLAEVGCSVCHEYSDYDAKPYQEGDDLLIVEAVCRPRSVVASALQCYNEDNGVQSMLAGRSSDLADYWR